MRRPLVVGEAPSPLSGTAFSPACTSSRRLRALAECSLGLELDAVNLLPTPVDDEVPWPWLVARESARLLYCSAFAGREVVLLGRRVARAFGGLSPWTDSLRHAPFFSMATPTVSDGRGGWGRCLLWLAPHPSGRSRWWNDERNRAAAEAFFGRVLGRTEFPRPPGLPTYIPPEDWAALAETDSWPGLYHERKVTP